jgi:hypothetical protein
MKDRIQGEWAFWRMTDETAERRGVTEDLGWCILPFSFARSAFERVNFKYPLTG